MELQSDFNTFLREIRLTGNQREDLQMGHNTLRERLNADETISPIIISDFLQGSYRRGTAVRPNGDARADVDIIVVTKLSEAEYSPSSAMGVFTPFLDRHYKGKWRLQGRSFGIELTYVELDLVITSVPSESEIGILKSSAVKATESIEEARDWKFNSKWISPSERSFNKSAALLLKESALEEEWKTAPLRIPDRDTKKWENTHPLEQIRWTNNKNSRTGGHFVNIVKTIKWWKHENHADLSHPKGFPLERIVGECCPDTISSVADGITRTFEGIVEKFSSYVQGNSKPQLPDYGATTQDVLAKVSIEDFKVFYSYAKKASLIAREALDSSDREASSNLWRKLLGNKFPEPPKGGNDGKGFAKPDGPATPSRSRFA